MKIFLQTDFQKDWAKDKEMTGIFHFFHLSLESTIPDHCAKVEILHGNHEGGKYVMQTP